MSDPKAVAELQGFTEHLDKEAFAEFMREAGVAEAK